MSKGLVPAIASLLLILSPAAFGQAIYKVVNPDGSVTYTDQKPNPGAEPVELQPLSVIETNVAVPEDTGADDAGAAAAEGADPESAEPTRAELRRMYRDFRISQPMDEETFWGTGNEVTVSWATSTPLREGMSVTLYVDGESRDATRGSVTLVLDRGSHEVYAVLQNDSGQRIAATAPVTFFVKQHSVNFNRGGGGP